jgi:predicted DNA binding CopG/RHH family protein
MLKTKLHGPQGHAVLSLLDEGIAMSKSAIKTAPTAEDLTSILDKDDYSISDDTASTEITELAFKHAGTQLISIRMSAQMIESLKLIAEANNGIGYQTLIKQILQRFIDGEMRQYWNAHLAEQARLAKSQGELSPVNKRDHPRLSSTKEGGEKSQPRKELRSPPKRRKTA